MPLLFEPGRTEDAAGDDAHSEGTMNASLELTVSRPEQVRDAIVPSFRDSGVVAYNVSADDMLHVDIEAETLGQLRGAVNTALMLVKLSDNVLHED